MTPDNLLHSRRSIMPQLEVLVCDWDRRPRAGASVSLFVHGAEPQYALTDPDGIAHFVAPDTGIATIAVRGVASQHELGVGRGDVQRIVIARLTQGDDS